MARNRRHTPRKAADRQASSDKRQKLIEKMRATLAAKAAAARIEGAAQNLPGSQIDPKVLVLRRPSHPNTDTLSDGVSIGLDTFRACVKSGNSVVALTWPEPIEGIASLHGLAMLSEIAEGPELYRGLSTLFFPASARTGANQKGLLVDRDWLISINKHWLNATVDDLREAKGTSRFTKARFHAVLSLLNELQPKTLQKYKRGEAIAGRDDNRSHPTLHELVARRTVKANGEISAPDETFLVRTRKLSRLLSGRRSAEDYQRVEAVEPLTTPWLLSAIHGASPNTRWNACTTSVNRRPDVILLDLQYRARARLGENWKTVIKEALAKLSHGDASTPVVVFTDSPFVANFARYQLLGQRSRKSSNKPAQTRFIPNVSMGLLESQTQGALNLSDIRLGEIEIEIFGSDLAAFESQARKLSAETANLSDGLVARSINQCLNRIKAVANIPVSISDMYDLLTKEEHGELRIGALEALNITGALAKLLEAAPHADRYEGDVSALIEHARELALRLSQSAKNGTGARIKKRFQTISRRANRTLVVAQSSSAARMLEAWLESEPELEDVCERLGEKFNVVDPKRAISELRLGADSTRPFGHMLLLSTPPSHTLAMLMSDVCPKKVELLFDAASAKYLTHYSEALRDLLSDSGVKNERFAAIVGQLEKSLGADLTRLPNFSFDLLSSRAMTALDLRSASPSGRHATHEITTTDGETVLAWQDTQIVTRKAAEIDVFELVACGSLSPGQEILVPRPEFIEAISSANEFRAAAAPLLAQYHECVSKAANALFGSTLREKAEAIHQVIVADLRDPPTSASVHRWLDVQRQVEVPAELRVPQAPRTHTHYSAFMRALKVDETLAETFWSYAILMTRSSRIRSGFMQRQLYLSALIDPEALERQIGSESGLIEFIRNLAEQYIVEVFQVKIKPEGVE